MYTMVYIIFGIHVTSVFKFFKKSCFTGMIKCNFLVIYQKFKHLIILEKLWSNLLVKFIGCKDYL